MASATNPKDALLGSFGGSSNHHQMANTGMKTSCRELRRCWRHETMLRLLSRLIILPYTTQDRPEINVSNPNAKKCGPRIGTNTAMLILTIHKSGIPITLVEQDLTPEFLKASFTTGTSSATWIQITSRDEV